MLMGWVCAMSWGILALCPGLGHARFTGGSDCPPVPAASGPQQGTKVAAGTPSFHVLLTPILMKSCGFWLRLAKSVFFLLLRGEIGSKAGGCEEQQPGGSVPCLSLGKPISAGACDPSDPRTHPAPSLVSEKIPSQRVRAGGSICPTPAPLRASK